MNNWQSFKNTSTEHAKIIVVGNPGRGKSSICNALVGRQELFRTALSPTSVTKNLQAHKTSEVPRFTSCHVVDVPGLLEAGRENEAHNSAQIQLATHCDNTRYTPTIVLFVADASGRIDPDDVEAYEAICKDYFCVHQKPCCVIVGNRAPEATRFREGWSQGFREQVRGAAATVVFLPKVNDEDAMVPSLRVQVLGAISGASPMTINPSNTPPLSKYTREVQRQQWLAEENRRRLEEQRAQEYRERQAALEREREEAERERARESERRRREFEQLERERERERERLRELQQQENLQNQLLQLHHQMRMQPQVAFVPGLGYVMLQPRMGHSGMFHPHFGFM